MLTVCSRTHPGSVRTVNEDVALWDPDLGLIAVADGMGGHNAGEIASRMAVDAVQAFLRQTAAAAAEVTWPFGVDPALSFSANRLRTAVKLANMRIHRAAEEHAGYTGMGTTIVAALVEGARVTYTGVGDSRIYLCRRDEFVQLTADDSWICLLQKESGLAPSAFARHPMRHVLTSVVGARADVNVRVQDLMLVDGETLVLCSDGLHGALPDHRIAETLRSEADLNRACSALVDSAVRSDGSDNVTILLARHHSN
jgi:serine/threonine protein phosphatase PrpC